MENAKQRKLVVTLALSGLIILLFFWFISYSNKMGAEAEKNRVIRARSLEILEKTKELSYDFLVALRGVTDTEVQTTSMKPGHRELNLQRFIMFNRLDERKETADFLKIQDPKFYEESIIEPARVELQRIWEESQKANKGACDLAKPNHCYPTLTQKMEELRELRRKLEEIKGKK